MSPTTPEEAWEVFSRCIPSKLVPTTYCKKCHEHIDWQEVKFQNEEFSQMRDAFIDVVNVLLRLDILSKLEE
jgi:hypothetical protein